MNAAANAHAIPGRPRLKPGVPAGGIAAVGVLATMLVLGIIAGDDIDSDGHRPRVSVNIGGVPVPPVPPVPPVAPRPPDTLAEADAIRGAVAEALRGLDVDAIQRDAMAAVEDAHRELAQLHAEMEASASRSAIEAVQPHRSNTMDTVFDAPGGVQLMNLRGEITVKTGAPGKVRLLVEDGGRQLRTGVSDGILTVASRPDGRPIVGTLEVPAESRLVLAAFNGDMRIDSDFRGDLTAEIHKGEITGGRLANATIQIMESGEVTLDQVDGKFGLSVFGSGNATVTEAGSVTLELAGSSDVNIERVSDGASLVVPGKGDVRIGNISGKAQVAIMGSGDILIEDGRLDTLDVAVMGSGDFVFNGVAVSPSLFMGGTGTIIVPNIEGEPRISNQGSGEIVTRP